MQTASANGPKSLLFVCVGNTCRGPMAEALARRRWPNSRIMSVGTNVQADSKGAADEAVTVMRSVGLDIGSHKTTSLQDIDAREFQFIVALSKDIKRELIEKHAVPGSKIVDLFVDDPFGDDIGQYRRCADRINRDLNSLTFSN